MKFDFSNVDDVQSYVSVPPGKHLCRLTGGVGGLV